MYIKGDLSSHVMILNCHRFHFQLSEILAQVMLSVRIVQRLDEAYNIIKPLQSASLSRIRKDEELETYSVENSNLAKENKRLKDQLNEAEREARNARSLRDELDIFREKATKADRVEAELDLAKHKLEELEYYRQRLEVSCSLFS